MRPRPITRQVRPIYRAAFNGEALPAGSKVWLVDRITTREHRMGNQLLGLCTWRGHYVRGVWTRGSTVYLSRRAWRAPNGAWNPTGSGWLGVLLHEWMHARGGSHLRHGAEFSRLVAAAYERVWESR